MSAKYLVGIRMFLVALLLFIIILTSLFIILHKAGAVSFIEEWFPQEDPPTTEPISDTNTYIIDNDTIIVENPEIQKPTYVDNDTIIIENKTTESTPLKTSLSDKWSISITAKIRLYYVRNPYILPSGSLSGGEIFSREVGAWFIDLSTYIKAEETFLIEIWLLTSVSINQMPQGVSKFTVYIGNRPVYYRDTLTKMWNVYKLGEGIHSIGIPIKIIYVKNNTKYIHQFTKTLRVEFTITITGQYEYQKMTTSGWITAYKPIYTVKDIKIYAMETAKPRHKPQPTPP